MGIKKRPSQEGFTLVEILIAAGIMSMIMMAFLSMQNLQQKAGTGTQTVVTRNLLELTLQQTLASLNNRNVSNLVYQNTITDPANAGFKSCLSPTSTSPCTAVTNASFNLRNSSNAIIGAPTLYDFMGSPCTTASSRCLFQILTNYTSSCGGPASCPSGVTLTVQYTVQQNPAVTTPLGGTPLAPITGSFPLLGALSTMITTGFCTPANAWDNSNLLTCPALTGYSAVRLTGVNVSAGVRYSGCCYIPSNSGSNGWCSPAYPSWTGSFSGCGAGTASYSAVRLQGVITNVADYSQCCFIPSSPVTQIPTSVISAVFGCDNYFSGCGGPFADYTIIIQNTVTGGLGRNCSCTYVPN